MFRVSAQEITEVEVVDNIRVPMLEDVNVVAADSVRMLAEVQPSWDTRLAAEVIANGCHFRDQTMDCIDLFYHDEDIDDWLGFDLRDGGTADVVD